MGFALSCHATGRRGRRHLSRDRARVVLSTTPSRGRRRLAGAHAGAVGAARRLQSAARSGLAWPNSLRSLRSLRSDSGHESDDEARCARRPRSCASRRSRNRPRQSPPAARLQRRGSDERRSRANRVPSAAAKARAGRTWCASEAPRSAGLVAARAARIVHLTRRRCPSAVSEANEASSATGHETEHRRGVGACADRLREAPRPARTRLCRSEPRTARTRPCRSQGLR